MPIILHIFRDHIVNPDTEILILGTFNPDVPNGPTFFYGRPLNSLWRLLPGCWDLPSLKNETLDVKQAFMSHYKIDFADIIHSVDVPEGEENNVKDNYIDDKVFDWKDIKTLIGEIKQIKAIYFTRTTFGGIPNIRAQIFNINDYCIDHNIRFSLLHTPAWYANDPAVQVQWRETIQEGL